jgi:chitinase
MAYDVYGSWSDSTGPIAPLKGTCAGAGADQSVETGLQVALKQGFKAPQILLGIPGYAKRFQILSPKLVPKTVGKQTSFYYQKKSDVTPVSRLIQSCFNQAVLSFRSCPFVFSQTGRR